MRIRRFFYYCALLGLLLPPAAIAMGLRSFVALPVEKGGTVLRAAGEHNADTNANQLALSAAYGLDSRQTLFVGGPYRLSSGSGQRMGDISLLYRSIVRQVDIALGTDRLGVLGGMVLPTDGNRDAAVQAGAVVTHFRGRNEVDMDVLYQQGLGSRKNAGRYDLSWQYRLRPPEYPTWGIPIQWYVVTELGGRWLQHERTVHQLTLGLQRVARRWVFEGGVTQDVNGSHNTRYLFSVRFH